MKDRQSESKAETKATFSPYQAKRAEAQIAPVSRLARAGGALLQLQQQYGNRYVQRLLVQRSTGFELDDETTRRIQGARGGGRPLESALRERMSASLGYDFSAVRVHSGPESDALNHQLSARAFTTGWDIFVQRGAYHPGSDSGRALIAHELSHVVQQTTGRVRGSRSGMTVRPAGDVYEREADALARQAADPSREDGV